MPVHLPYNLAIIDRSGDWLTVFISPDREPEVRREPYSANRQDSNLRPDDPRIVDTVRREALLENVIGNPNETLEHLSDRFLQAPIYRPVKKGDWGTVYTACYRPADASVRAALAARQLAAIDRGVRAGRAAGHVFCPMRGSARATRQHRISVI